MNVTDRIAAVARYRAQSAEVREIIRRSLRANGCVRMAPESGSMLNVDDCNILSNLPPKTVRAVLARYPWVDTYCTQTLRNPMQPRTPRPYVCNRAQPGYSGLGLTPAEINLQLIQSQLNLRLAHDGFELIPVDGKIGPKTCGAARHYGQSLTGCTSYTAPTRRAGSSSGGSSSGGSSSSGGGGSLGDKIEAMRQFFKQGASVTVPATMTTSGQPATFSATRIFEVAWDCLGWGVVGMLLMQPWTWPGCVLIKLGLRTASTSQPDTATPGQPKDDGPGIVDQVKQLFTSGRPVKDVQKEINVKLIQQGFLPIAVDGKVGPATCGAGRQVGIDVAAQTKLPCTKFTAPTRAGTPGGGGGGDLITGKDKGTTPSTAQAGKAPWAMIGFAAVVAAAYLLNEDRKKQGLEPWW